MAWRGLDDSYGQVAMLISGKEGTEITGNGRGGRNKGRRQCLHAGREKDSGAALSIPSESPPTTQDGGGNLLAARFMSLVEFFSRNEEPNETEPGEKNWES